MTCRVVYRVEREDGTGPHWGNIGTHKWNCGCAGQQPGRLSPMEVGSPLFDHSGLGNYGCTSMAALCAWFNEEERENLHALGFVVAVYMVRPGRSWEGNVHPDGARQIMFDAGIADRTDSFSLLEVAA